MRWVGIFESTLAGSISKSCGSFLEDTHVCDCSNLKHLHLHLFVEPPQYIKMLG